jgi:hypothetical protein
MNAQFTTQQKSFAFEYWLPDGRHGVYSAIAYNAGEAEERALSQLVDIFGLCEIAIQRI